MGAESKKEKYSIIAVGNTDLTRQFGPVLHGVEIVVEVCVPPPVLLLLLLLARPDLLKVGNDVVSPAQSK